MKARIPGGVNTGNMMKKIQDMQADMENKQAEIEASEFTASAGGGAVEVTVAGTHEVKSIKISLVQQLTKQLKNLSTLCIRQWNK